MQNLRPIMLAGTGSDVGKSLIAAGLCRIFRQDGLSPAPFKAQNMALNSAATPDGLEIGRAQAVQAEAAGAIPCSDMNPLLLKPQSDHTSQVVLNGRTIGNRDAYQYYRNEGRDHLRKQVNAAFDRLKSRYNPIVMEGAGSIAELNLRSLDLVNMSMARYADAAVLLVTDIDRGGVFASAYGSVMLQEPEDRQRIKGIIVNKFRGDIRLFEEGRSILERICGVPVVGVVPYMTDIAIDDEDSVALDAKAMQPVDGKINVAVIRLPHISNFTDFATLSRVQGVNLYYTTDPAAVDCADIVILPGSKNTVGDLNFVRSLALDKAVFDAARKGKRVFGICGGYQMLGQRIEDPNGIEGVPGAEDALGLLPVVTTLAGTKVTKPSSFVIDGTSDVCKGYEIHMGRTILSGGRPFCTTTDGFGDGCMASANIAGTYMHGVLDNAAAIRWLLSGFGPDIDIPDPAKARDAEYDKLAAHLRRHLNIELIYNLMRQ